MYIWINGVNMRLRYINSARVSYYINGKWKLRAWPMTISNKFNKDRYLASLIKIVVKYPLQNYILPHVELDVKWGLYKWYDMKWGL